MELVSGNLNLEFKSNNNSAFEDTVEQEKSGVYCEERNRSKKIRGFN